MILYKHRQKKKNQEQECHLNANFEKGVIATLE